MRRILKVLLLITVMSLLPIHLGASDERRFIGCDPRNPLPLPQPIPDGEGIRCGDGQIGEYTASCAKYCGSNGCKMIDCETAPVKCTKVREACDSKNLGGATCRQLGFWSGRLKCHSSCLGFDVSACALCQKDSANSCHSLYLPQEALPTQAPIVIPTPKGIAMAWGSISYSGTPQMRLVLIDQRGKIQTVADSSMSGWLGASQPRLLMAGDHLVMIARKDFKLLIQEFDLSAKPIGEVFGVSGDVLMDVKWVNEHLMMIVRSRYSQDSSIQYVSLQSKQVVPPPPQTEQTTPGQAIEHSGNGQSALPVYGKPALTPSQLLTQRFMITSRNFVFEGAFVPNHANVPGPSSALVDYWTSSTEQAQLVVAVRKTRK